MLLIDINHVLQSEEIKNIEQPTVTIFGVSYKGNIDDARETPALQIIGVLGGCGCKIKIYDPIAVSYAKQAITRGLDMSLERGLELESNLGKRLLAS